MTELIVYSREKNPQCEELKNVLKEGGVHYHEIDIRNPEAITELQRHGCFSLEPPVIRVVHASRFQQVFKNDDLFWDGHLIREAVMDVMQVSRSRVN